MPAFAPSRASFGYYGVTIEALLKSFNMKQSSESRVCVLCFTRDCIMLFNPHKYKVFETECNTVWKWFKRVGGVRWSEEVGGLHFATHQAWQSQVK